VLKYLLEKGLIDGSCMTGSFLPSAGFVML